MVTVGEFVCITKITRTTLRIIISLFLTLPCHSKKKRARNDKIVSNFKRKTCNIKEIKNNFKILC